MAMRREKQRGNEKEVRRLNLERAICERFGKGESKVSQRNDVYFSAELLQPHCIQIELPFFYGARLSPMRKAGLTPSSNQMCM